ncbi:MAG: flavin-dependent oxidoreductase [Acidimicrobiales bacterium]
MTRVLIAGGGIGGLSAALSLHRAGHEVTVFESVTEPRELGVGINLLPHSVRILHDLGLEDALSAVGIKTKRLSFYSEDGVKIWEEPRGLDAGNPWPQYSLHRGRFQMLLLGATRAALGEDRVRTGHHLVGYEQDATGVRATFVDKRTGAPVGTYEGDVLVGADGLHSALRKILVPADGPPFYSGLMLWRGAIETDPFLDGESMFMAGNDDKKAVVYPIGEPERQRGRSLVNWIAERPLDFDVANADWNRESSAEAFVDAFETWDWGWIDLPKLFRDTPVCYEFPMVDRHPLDRWTYGRVTLLGDAAHAMRPNGSNGSSQAIIDGEALATAINEEADVLTALDRYEEARLGPTAALTLANRSSGPEAVLQWVKERCDGTCVDTHTCVDMVELEQAATAYKRLAGFDPAQLRAKASEH